MGDESCFLFNLSLNLRFNTMPGKMFYQKVDDNSIMFGDGVSVINEDFDRVTSEIKQTDSRNKKP